MTQVSLPAPELRQVESTATPLVRVVLRNNVRHRRVWVDSDTTAIVGEAVMKDLSEEEKRLINFAAEYGEINVSDAVRLTKKSWSSAKRLLEKLVIKKIMDYESARPGIIRYPKSKFRIRHRPKPSA